MKYGNIITEIDGIKFSSKKEAGRYLELKMLEKAGKIKLLYVKVRHEIIPKNEHFRAIVYESDFEYWEDGKLNQYWVYVVEDVKPTFASKKSEKKYKSTPAYRMFTVKKKLMYHIHGILITEV